MRVPLFAVDPTLISFAHHLTDLILVHFIQVHFPPQSSFFQIQFAPRSL